MQVEKIDAAQRAKMISDRIKNQPIQNPTAIPRQFLKPEKNLKARSEIQSRERGYVPPESSVSYGITLSKKAFSKSENTNIISAYSCARIKAEDRAREIQKKRELEYAKNRLGK